MYKKLKILWILLLVFLLISTATGIGIAAAQDSPSEQDNGTIYACYKVANGQLRIVDDCSECRPNELPLSWEADCGCEITLEQFNTLVARVEALEQQQECIDSDGDTYGNGEGCSGPDCDDNDSSIYPGAFDKPDDNFIDSNCDGIDGDIEEAIFVATSGLNSNSGTSPDVPKATIQAGIDAAHSLGRDYVLVSEGYPGTAFFE